MSLREQNAKWQYRFQLNGETVSKQTDLEATEENRPKAERLERKHRDSILKGDVPVRRQLPRGFQNASVEFLAALRAKQKEKPSTIRRIETSLWSLREWFENKGIATVKTSDVERYSQWRLTEHKVQPITLRHDLDNLSKLFEWAMRMDLCAANPVRKCDKPSSENAVREHVLTPAEEFDYFERIAQDGYDVLGDVARLILDQGMRPDEVVSLERKSCDLRLGRVSILQGKTKAAKRTLKLTPASLMIVERRMAAAPSRWLFPSPRVEGAHYVKLNGPHDAVCASCNASPGGLPDRTELLFVLYDLRHTFATRAAQNGMDVVTLAAILGHNSLRMVMRYVHPQQNHMDLEMEKLAQANSKPTAIHNQANFEQISANNSQAEKEGVSRWKN